MPKNVMIFRYRDIIDPRLDIALYTKGRLCREESFEGVGDFSDEGIAYLAEKITNAFGKAAKFDLAVSSPRTFKGTVNLPPMMRFRANRLKKKQFLFDYPDCKKKYYAVPVEYSVSSGYSFGRYFIRRDIVDGFKRLAAALGVKCLSYNILAEYLLSKIEKTEPFSALFRQGGGATFFCSAEGKLLSAIDIPYDEKEIFRTRTLMQSYCEKRFSIKFEKFYVCSEEDAARENELTLDGAEDLPINFSTYSPFGIKL